MKPRCAWCGHRIADAPLELERDYDMRGPVFYPFCSWDCSREWRHHEILDRGLLSKVSASLGSWTATT